jgi:hypothetical protein
MRSSHPGSFREQVSFLRRQFLQDGDLPFADVLTEEVGAGALSNATGWLDRGLLAAGHPVGLPGAGPQADHSCRAAVASWRHPRPTTGSCPASSGRTAQAAGTAPRAGPASTRPQKVNGVRRA